MSEPSSFAKILRASSVLGAASVVTVLCGLLRTKVAALLLGPAGLGLIGLLQSLMNVAATLTALGIAPAATRQIAKADAAGDAERVAVLKRALWQATAVTTGTGFVLLLLFRGLLARHVLGDANQALAVALVGVGLLAGGFSGSQIALLSAVRQPGLVARIQVGAALLSTLAAIAALFAFRADGLALYVIASPVAAVLVGAVLARRFFRPGRPARPRKADYTSLARLGVPLMLGGFAGGAAQLAARMLVGDRLGAVPLGLMQAAWMLPAIYGAVVLQAMQLDYYPRLATVIHDREAASRMVNEQAEALLLLLGPPLMLAMTAADGLIWLLYAREFAPAADILRWMVLADAVRFLSWTLAFVLLASARGTAYLGMEAIGAAALVAAIWLGLPILGLGATGVGVLAAYVIYGALLYGLVRRQIGLRWSGAVVAIAGALIGSLIAIGVLAKLAPPLGVGLGAMLTLAASAFALRRLARLGAFHGLIFERMFRTRR